MQSPNTQLPKESQVKDQIAKGEFKWYESLINRIFSEEKAEMIKRIPISMRGKEDKLFWGGTKMGMYQNGNVQVKNAYHMA